VLNIIIGRWEGTTGRVRQPVSGRALDPAVQIDHPKNNESRWLFAYAGASHPAMKRPLGRKVFIIWKLWWNFCPDVDCKQFR